MTNTDSDNLVQLLAPDAAVSGTTQELVTHIHNYRSVVSVGSVDNTSSDSSDEDSEHEQNYVKNIISKVCSSNGATTIGNLTIQDSNDVHVGPNTTLQIEGPVTIQRKVIKTVRQSSQVQINKTLSIESPTGVQAQLSDEELKSQQDDQDKVMTFPLMITREQWEADPPIEETQFQNPVPFVIVSHTATDTSTNTSDCILMLQAIQRFHMGGRGWSDIAYNFVIGGDGHVYEGRGWDLTGAHAYGYNKLSLGVSFLGTYITTSPSQLQLETFKSLLDLGVRLGKIRSDYRLIGHRQVSPTVSPGDALFSELQRMDHWSEDTSI